VDLDRGRNTERVDRLPENVYLISAATLMELSTGRNLNDASEKEFQRVFDNLEIVPVDRKVADKAGEIMADLIDRGERIEINDVYISATCRVHSEPVLTANTEHFERVQGVEVRDWERI